MEQYLNAAVIGCGRMGAFTGQSVIQNSPSCWFPHSHSDAILAHPNLNLNAICDTNNQSLIKAREADKFHEVRTYDNPSNLFKCEKIQLLGIATRTIGRSELIRSAYDVGIRAIHVEKPLCNTVLELQLLSKLFDSKDFFVTWGALRRYFSVYKQALLLAESGLYGALREVRVNFGSAPLYWTHAHSIDLLLFAAAGRRIEGVQAKLIDVAIQNKNSAHIESDPRILTASVYFEGGLVGNITQALGSDFVLSCEDAEITVRADGAKLEMYSSKKNSYATYNQIEIKENSSVGGSLAPISLLVDCLKGNRSSILDNEIIKQDIINAQWIAFSMMQSHLEGSRILDFSSVDPNLVIWGRTEGRYA